MIHPTGLATHGLDVRQFLDFLEYRPDEEKWELIDGYALMMAPPTFGHQRISGNLWRALNDRLELAKPEWLAHFEVGIELPEYSRYRPEPDVMVVDELGYGLQMRRLFHRNGTAVLGCVLCWLACMGCHGVFRITLLQKITASSRGKNFHATRRPPDTPA